MAFNAVTSQSSQTQNNLPQTQNVSGRPAGASGTIEIRMPDGKTYAIYNAIERALYSTGQVANGQTQATVLFSKGINDPIPGIGSTRTSTPVDTNLPRPGQMGLPPAWEMLIYGLACGFIRASGAAGNATPAIAPDASEPVSFDAGWAVERLLYNRFKYNGITYADGTMMDYPDGRGFVSQSDLSGFSLAQNGRQDPRARVAYVIPIHETEGLKFSWTLQPVVALVVAMTGRITVSNTYSVLDIKARKIGFLQTGGQDGASID